MISDKMKQFFENLDYAFVASASETGLPHLGAGREIEITDPSHVVFKAWCCHTTLANVRHNPRVAVTLIDPASGVGYQLAGYVEKSSDTAILDGLAPGREEPGIPQIQYRFIVRVEEVMEFSPGPHSDRSL
jgi:predicted pyridoxine 5'-phosphate oxidase superfamily flavin-nucleotide-binding protein